MTEPVRLRQIALVAEGLSAAAGDVRAVFDLGAPFADPGVGVFGLENAVFAVGDTFLEIVSPRQGGTTAGRLLEKRGGDGGYMVIVQVRDDLPAHRNRMAELGVRIVWETEIDDMATLHLHPKDVGGAILSLDVARPASSWRWGGPTWKDEMRTTRVRAIVGAEVAGAEPDRMAARWATVLGRGAPERREGAEVVDLDGGVLRFVEASEERAEGLCGVTVATTDREAIVEAAAARGLPHDAGRVILSGVSFELA